jgi:hypothetical protein
MNMRRGMTIWMLAVFIATPPSTKYQHANPLSQIAILKRMVLWAVVFRHDTSVTRVNFSTHNFF